MENFLRYKQARHITLIGVVVNIVLAVAKIMGGMLGNSHALMADGVHSLSDLLTDVLVLFATKYGSRGADDDHPYGHHRIETAATVALALILVTVGIFIAVDSGTRLFSGQPVVIPHIVTLIIALLSIASKEILFHATLRVAKQLNSNLLKANAWHHRSDAASSLIVVIGIAGALLGYAYLDNIAAVIVGILIVKMGAELAWVSVRELVDTGLDATMVAKIQQVITNIVGVKAIHQLRTRTMGHAVFVDVHIQVAPHLSVSEGHFIGQQVHYGLMHAIDSITDVTVHIDPEDDTVADPPTDLPARNILIPQLHQRWEGLSGADSIIHFTLHYLDKKIYVEISLPIMILQNVPSIKQLTRQYQQAVEGIVAIGSVKLFFM
ncbi:MAG: cation diffusion facilitator family transporter [Gammaproteobacteria bacterium]